MIRYGSDTGQQLVWDEAIRKYVAFGRFKAGGRNVARAESDDLVHWTEPKRVFEVDSGDRPGTQIYGMGISRYEGIYIGMPWMFHFTSTHRIDVQLASSRDGRQWHRAADRRVLIPNGPPDRWDAGIIFTASQPVQVHGDRIFIFYSASSHDHDHAYLHADSQKQGTPEWFRQFRKVGTSIGAGAAPGVVTTACFVWPADAALRVNVDAVQGELQVEVLDGAGALVGSVTTETISGDRLAAIALSRRNAAILAGRTVRLRFRLRQAAFYAWWLDKPARSE